MKASPIVVQTVTDRLHAAIGVDPRGLDAKRLQGIIGSRCRQLKLQDASAYLAYLEEAPAEIDALIDEVVVRETRFFRDPVVFDHVRQAIAQFTAADSGPLRILSAPCGTGAVSYTHLFRPRGGISTVVEASYPRPVNSKGPAGSGT